MRALDAEAASGQPFEAIVSVDGADDGSADALRSLPLTYPTQVLEQPRGGPAAARNAAAAVASGDLLLFLDDDTVPLPGLVAAHVAAHRSQDHLAVIGTMLPPPTWRLSAWLRWEAYTLLKHYDAMSRHEYEPTARQFFTANASISRTDFVRAGAFDEGFTRGEDVELAYRLEDRAGVRFRFAPEAAVLHEPERSYESWIRGAREYGRHDVRLGRQRGREWVLQTARRELAERGPIVLGIARWAVGHRARVRAVSVIARALLALADRGPARVAFAICAVVFTVQYWDGIAEATGHGVSVWHSSFEAVPSA
jgi:GT2 family glycosyltransferase